MQLYIIIITYNPITQDEKPYNPITLPYLLSSLILKVPQELRSTLCLPALLCGFLDVHLFLHPSQSRTPTNAAGDLKASTNNYTFTAKLSSGSHLRCQVLVNGWAS